MTTVYASFSTDWPAQIVGRGIAERCRVVEISIDGVRIECHSASALPATVKLVLADPKFRAQCRLRHSAGTQADLQFVQATSIPLPF